LLFVVSSVDPQQHLQMPKHKIFRDSDSDEERAEDIESSDEDDSPTPNDGKY